MEGFEVSRQQAWLKRMRGTVGNCSRGPREARTGFLRIGIRPPLSVSPGSPVLCRGSLDALPGAVDAPSRARLKRPRLSFPSENGIKPSSPVTGRFRITNRLLIVEDPEPALRRPNKLMCANGT